MSASLSDRLRHDTWANDALYQALKSQGAPERALRAFQHILETEITWSNRILGLLPETVPLWGELSLGQCDEWLAVAREQLERIAVAEEADGYQRRFSYRNSAGQAFEDTVEDVLEHMLIHSAQYRGEAAGLSNAAGARMPDLDYIFWARKGRPTPGS